MEYLFAKSENISQILELHNKHYIDSIDESD